MGTWRESRIPRQIARGEVGQSMVIQQGRLPFKLTLLRGLQNNTYQRTLSATEGQQPQ